MRVRHVSLSVLAVAACWAATPATHAQNAPACQDNAGANIDRPQLVAWGRSGIIKVFAETPEAQATGTFSVSSKDPAHPISHPVSMAYAQLGEEEGNRRYRFKAEKGDGDALVAFTWTKVENNTTCTARVSQTITVNKGKRPFISIVHERSPKIIFGHEKPDCTETQVVSWKMVVTGPGGTVRESIADVCGESKFFHRRGSNAHFTVTARSGVMVFTARRPHGEYKASYRVTIGGKLAVKGGLRALVKRGKVIVMISIKRP